MAIFRSARQWLARRILNDAIGTSRQLADLLYGSAIETEVGLDVTPDVAMRLSAVYACVRVLAEDMAKLPLVLYQKIDGGTTRADDHWLATLLARPNPFQTGFEFREMQQAHLELCGNFYGIKTVVGREVREVLPVSPDRMCVELTPQWVPKYTVTLADGTQMVVPNDRIYHMRGLSLNGYTGLSPVGYQRETIGFGMALRRYGSRLFKNGANVGGVIQHPGQLSDPAAKRLKESFEEKYSGLDNAHRVVLLEEGAKFTKTGMAADDAQFLESRKFSRSEICGMYRVPPHMIADLDRSTNNNIEQQALEYVQNGLLGRTTRLEERMALTLLSPGDRQTYLLKHSLDELLRGDFTTRMEGYKTAVLTGWMSRNEVRVAEGMNRGPAQLDAYLEPLNMSSSTRLPDPNKDRQVPAPAPDPATDPGLDPPAENTLPGRLHAIK